MANGSKKRKASELESDHKARGKSTGRNSNAKSVEALPFRPMCPYNPSNQPNDDVFVERETIAPGFEFSFGIRPGQKWNNMRQYRRVKLQDYTFSKGTVIYINKQVPPPMSPHPDATDAEILRYDRMNFWVGQIADTRAESHSAVFVRIYWLYWPEELPMGRQPYHGDRELVLSNAMDIVDAQTISGPVDLSHWDERDTTHLSQDRFWRQTFDISKLGRNKKGGLSELRKHCKCQQPHNPDKTMFQCKRPRCMIWNHEECLIKDTLERAWSVYENKGTLDELVAHTYITKEVVDEGEASLRDRILTPVQQLGKMMQETMTPAANPATEEPVAQDVPPNGATKKSKPGKKATISNKHSTKPWEGRLTLQINTDDRDDDSPLIARVTEVSSTGSDFEAKSWQLHVNCLLCEHAM